MDFDLWLEFEQYAEGYPTPGDNPQSDCCIINITIGSCRYAASVWTFGYLEYCRNHDSTTGESSETPMQYLVPPDFLVEQLSRSVIERAIRGLLLDGGLPERWRVEESDSSDVLEI